MEKNEYILSNEAIRNLTETTPFFENEPVGFEEDGDCWGFWLAAEQVAAASEIGRASCRERVLIQV